MPSAPRGRRRMANVSRPATSCPACPDSPRRRAARSSSFGLRSPRGWTTSLPRTCRRRRRSGCRRKSMPPDLPPGHPVLDLRGVRCPLSWAKAKVRLEELARGDVLDLLVDEPRGSRDIPRAAEAAGHHVVRVIEEDGSWRITVEV